MYFKLFVRKHFTVRLSIVAALLCWQTIHAQESPTAVSWNFTESSSLVGLDYSHSYDTFLEVKTIGAGLAIGDLNNDGWDDIFAVTGADEDSEFNPNHNKLFIAQGDGTFLESAIAWGLSNEDQFSTGPLIFDSNGDGRNDLLVGGVGTNRIKVYRNTGSNSFVNATPVSNLLGPLNTVNNMGMAAADINQDGDLDLFVAHWSSNNKPMLFENNGTGLFLDVTASKMTGSTPLWVFTPAFVDLNNDDRLDLALTNDFLNTNLGEGGSKYYLQDGSGVFILQGLPVPEAAGPDPDYSLGPDQNGMGGAFGDYDNDGDMDWFATSIWDSDGVTEGDWGVTGNRLYNNDGAGNFTDVTETAGVRVGYWGWGACWADFDNDSDLDLYHVNGYPALERVEEDEFEDDPARMFINNGDGTFTEQSAALGVDDTGQGRAILCFDNDRDGDIDILVNNNQGDSKFFKNNLDNGNNWIEIKLVQASPNHEAIGAKISLTAGGLTQIRQVFAGANYASSHPTAQHFGLGSETTISSIVVTWPDGQKNTWTNVASNQYLELDKVDNRIYADGFE
jgi:hypothetical protein